MNWLIKAGLVIGALYIVGALVLYFMQRRVTFSPDPTRVLVSAVAVPGLHEVLLETSDRLKLYCWWVRAKPGKPTLLFFHGNGGNVANREEKFLQLSKAGFGVFMLGYRGFGGSEGHPSEAAFVGDAQLAYSYLIEQGLSANDVVIYGESIGTSVAVQLATKVKTAALILEAPMYSVLSIAQDRYPYLPVRPFLRDKFETNMFIEKVSVPLLIVHGTDDGVINLASGQRLFEAANEPKTFYEVRGAEHNNLYEFPIVDEMVRFLKAHGVVRSELVE